jgi:hypothetical protein
VHLREAGNRPGSTSAATPAHPDSKSRREFDIDLPSFAPMSTQNSGASEPDNSLLTVSSSEKLE